jgi:hypothetical protein
MAAVLNSGRKRRRVRGAIGAALAFGLALVPASGASAAPLLDGQRASAAGTSSSSCFAGDLSSAPGVDARQVSLPGPGLLRASLTGADSADWDLAVLDRATGRVIAGSAQRGSSELAEGFVIEAKEAVVQACRRSGSGDAQLSAELIGLDASLADRTPQLVRVETPTRAAKSRLQSLGLDLTEHGGDDFLSVVAYGNVDLATLAANGFDYEVEVPDLVEKSIQDRQADQQFSSAARSSAAASSIPSERTTYRRLFDYQEELKQLAEDNPDLVKPITLGHETWEGRQVEGIEVTTDPENADDGKPVYLQMGLHHAREWPSGEHVMEYALELIQGYRAGDQPITDLVEGTRTIFIPAVNPDGFNVSREAGELADAGGGRHAGSEEEMIAQIAGIAYEYWRKNCRLPVGEAGQCAGQLPASGLAHPGVDPNRNYGGLWGGPGSDTNPLIQSYRGPAPFSEPETRNVQELVSARQVTTLITNHTFSNLWLRPPGQAVSPDSPDEELYHALGEEITEHNGYSNIRGYELYDTTGTTEDWSYWSTGGLGFTPEIGCTEKDGNVCVYGDFHGPYADHVVTEYSGGNDFAPDGGGNREGFLIAHENALNPDRHSLITGQAPADAVLRVQKTFQTETWQGQHGSFEDHLETAMEVPDSGQFDFHVNPSTRPIVLLAYGREATGDPSPPASFSGDASTAQPCADYPPDDPACWNDHTIEVPPNGDGIDNARMTVRLDWQTPASDWDLQVFRDSDGNGSSFGETELASSAQGPTNFEEAFVSEPNLESGTYVVRVTNFAAVEPYQGTVTFEGPPPPKLPGEPEAWTLTCERDGEVVSSAQVFVARGESQNLDLRQSCARDGDPGPGPGPDPDPTPGSGSGGAGNGGQGGGSAGPDSGVLGQGQGAGKLFKIVKVKRNRRKGTATLFVRVSTAGVLILKGRSLRRKSRPAAQGQTVKLPMRPKKKLKRMLLERSRAKTKVKLSFRPAAGGSQATRKVVKLRR